MTIKQHLRAEEFLKLQALELMRSCPVLTEQERYEQVLIAQKLRNIFFTVTGFPIPVNAGATLTRNAYTTPFSQPTVITDVISMFDFKINDPGLANWNNNMPRFLLQLLEFGGDGSYGADFFGLSSLQTSPQEFIVGHEKNYSAALGDIAVPDEQLFDTLGKHLEFAPRLLKPYQRLQARWLLNNNMPTTGPEPQLTPQLGFRGVRTLETSNPYGYLTPRVNAEVKAYIKHNDPETFLLELQIPFAGLPTLGATSLPFRTEPNERPLLVLGAISNLEGCQADLYDESKYHLFTIIDKRTNEPGVFVPEYKSIPLALWCPSNDFRNPNMYHMWAVPHFLEPRAQLLVTLTNGLQPASTGGGTWQIPAATRSSQAARIVFLCRTV